MQNNLEIIKYWQHAAQLEFLNNLATAQVKNFCHTVSAVDIVNGKITDQALLETILLRGGRIVVAPINMQLGEKIFAPYWLEVEINPAGKFIPSSICALPIVARSILEPSTLQPILLGSADDFDDYLVTNPAPWLGCDHNPIWAQQVEYANEMLRCVSGDAWATTLSMLQYHLHEDGLIIILSDLCEAAYMNVQLLGNAKRVSLIEAARCSGKSFYIREQIALAWLEAAVKQAQPPLLVNLQYGMPERYTSIFDCVVAEQMELPFAADLVGLKRKIHAELSDKFNFYFKGKALLKNWQDVVERNKSKYIDRGGIAQRILQLQENLSEYKINARQLSVLHAIWMRQVELVDSWLKIFDIFNWCRRQRLRKLYAFFAQHFPQEQLSTHPSQDELEQLFAERIKRSNSGQRMLADVLYQCENDIQQEQLMRDKCIQWCETQDLHVQNLEQVQDAMQQVVYPQLLSLAWKYWQVEFVLQDGFEDFLTRAPKSIEHLYVERAEYVSPMQAARLLAISQRATIMGNLQAITKARLAVQFDYELAKSYLRLQSDLDYEDLQFAGIAAATGNLWALATQEREVDTYFSERANDNVLYEICNVDGESEVYHGSRINLAASKKLLELLPNLLNEYSECEIGVYVAFAGQVEHVREQLLAAGYKKIAIWNLQTPVFAIKQLSVFMPVYSGQDSGPYVFDQGEEMLANMLANTSKKVLVIGDERIFKVNTHSPTGKLAQNLCLDATASSNITIDNYEVSCV